MAVWSLTASWPGSSGAQCGPGGDDCHCSEPRHGAMVNQRTADAPGRSQGIKPNRDGSRSNGAWQNQGGLGSTWGRAVLCQGVMHSILVCCGLSSHSFSRQILASAPRRSSARCGLCCNAAQQHASAAYQYELVSLMVFLRWGKKGLEGVGVVACCAWVHALAKLAFLGKLPVPLEPRDTLTSIPAAGWKQGRRQHTHGSASPACTADIIPSCTLQQNCCRGSPIQLFSCPYNCHVGPYNC